MSDFATLLREVDYHYALGREALIAEKDLLKWHHWGDLTQRRRQPSRPDSGPMPVGTKPRRPNGVWGRGLSHSPEVER